MILAPDEFRRIALSLPQAEETYRRGQSEFRVAPYVLSLNSLEQVAIEDRG
jgi:hypothetical protein